MILTLFGVLLALSLGLVALGLYRQEHAELGIIGFLFLFLLSFVVIDGGLTYQTGFTETHSYTSLKETPETSIDFLLNNTETVNTYSALAIGGTLDRTIGYYLAVCSAVGMIGFLAGLKRHGWRNTEL